MDKIEFDFNNMMASRLGGSGGISEGEIDEMMTKINAAIETVLRKEWGFMSLPYNEELVGKINETVAGRIMGRCDDFVVIGIGGSSLGSRALYNSLAYPYKNSPRIHILENIDPDGITRLLNTIDCKKTIFNIVTKSGGTAETMSSFMVFREKLIKRVGEKKHKAHIIVTTDPGKGVLREIASEEGYESFSVPPEVGGRFSVLSSVGLLPAAVMGIDIGELLAGARFVDGLSQNKNIWQNPACLAAVLQYLFYKKGKKIRVCMPYSNRLRDMAEWFCQLWAESLGKQQDVGSTPVRALGVIDQHSQLQLYMEGPEDKVITFVKVKEFDNAVRIPESFPDHPAVAYLGGHAINELLAAEQKATELALTTNNRPNNSIAINKITPWTVGGLLYYLEMETALAGELLGINAFNQPGVELGKKITGALMGRPGYEDRKKEIEQLPEEERKYII